MRTERRKLMAHLELPSSYQKLKYINNGDAIDGFVSPKRYMPFILTDTIQSNDIRIVLDVVYKYVKYYSDGFYWGFNSGGGYAPDNKSDTSLNFGINTDLHSIYISNPNSKRINTNHKCNYGTKIHIDMDFNAMRLYVDFGNGVKETVTGTPAANNTLQEKRISILTLTPYLPPFANLYRCKIFKGCKMVNYLVPAKRKSNGVIGMYDLVGRKFYTSPNGMLFSGGGKI